MGACFQRGHLTIVFDRQTEYIWCSDGDQDEIARKVMDQVTKLGGRFLLPSKKLEEHGPSARFKIRPEET
jgi:hypothetical protein